MTLFMIADKRLEECGYIKTSESRDYVNYICKDENGIWKYRLELLKSYGVRSFLHASKDVDICIPIQPKVMKAVLRKMKEKGWDKEWK